MKVGLLIIATRQYRQFVAPLLTHVIDYGRFFPDDDVEVHLFSELPHERTIWHPTEALTFPKVTLLRYAMFREAAGLLGHCDYLYYLDVDARLERVIGREALPADAGIVALHHTGFPSGSGAWEVRENYSWAYVAQHERAGQVYFMGGFNGGSTAEFLAMASELAQRTEREIQRGTVPVWHDESMMNRYLVTHPPALVLPQNFSGREGFPEFPERTITWLAKDHDKVRA